MNAPEKKLELRQILTIAMMPRLLAAVTSLGWDHPNEPLRTLEPMAALAGFSAQPPWEWTQGLLSSLPVYFHLTLAWPFQGTPIRALIWMKLVYALISLTLVAAAYLFTRSVRPKFAAPAALLVALWPELIFQSVRIMDYSLEAALLAGSLIAWTVWEGERRRWITVGLLLGCAFFVRPQSGLALLAFLVVSDRKEALQLAGVYLGTILGLGLLEMAIDPSHSFLGPFRNYIQYNWIQDGAAKDYGADPWHRYFTEAGKYWGWSVFFLALPALFLRPVFTEKRNWLAVALFAIPFVVHSMIAHKEGRFLYGSLWVLAPLAVLGFSTLKNILQKRVWIALAVFGFAINAHRVSQKWTQNHEATLRMARVGEEVRESTEPPNRAVSLSGNALSDPSGFLLRTHRRICYGKCSQL